VRESGAALVAGLRAPLVRWRLVLLLWLSRLLPAVLAFGLPAYARAHARSAHHPDAGLLLDPARDAEGFCHSWTADFFRDGWSAAPEVLFWVVVCTWVLVTCLAGGIVARLVHGGSAGLFLAECGRYAGRFLRLGLVAAFCFYLADLACNALLAELHAEGARRHATEDYVLSRTWMRGTLFLALVYVLGLVHAYARIDIVAHERRSALLAFLRAVATLALNLPRLLVVEVGMLALAGLAALVALVVARGAAPTGPQASLPALGAFFLLALLASYLRSGVELGAMDARCRLLAPRASRIETAAPPAPEPD
jgi:hypothetical protein